MWESIGLGATNLVNSISNGVGSLLGAGGNNSLYGTTAKDGGLIAGTAQNGQAIWENGGFTDYATKNFNADTLNTFKASNMDGSNNSGFDFNTTINNAAKLGNMYSTWQDQKMKKEYFEAWKENNAYNRQKAEEQEKGRRGLARSLSE